MSIEKEEIEEIVHKFIKARERLSRFTRVKEYFNFRRDRNPSSVSPLFERDGDFIYLSKVISEDREHEKAFCEIIIKNIENNRSNFAKFLKKEAVEDQIAKEFKKK